MRVNVSVAMVAMVNDTKALEDPRFNDSRGDIDICPGHIAWNSTETGHVSYVSDCRIIFTLRSCMALLTCNQTCIKYCIVVHNHLTSLLDHASPEYECLKISTKNVK